MPDYSLEKIYKIVCNDTSLIYIGSTTEPTLARRLANHKRHLNHWESGKGGYVTSYQILQNGNYDIVLIENYPCDSKDDLHKRERYYIESMNCVNKVIPKRTHKEYFQQYKDKITAYQKDYSMDYRTKNKDKLKDDRKQYYDINKEIILSKQKQYVENHIDETKTYKHKWYEENKQDIMLKRKEHYEKNKEAIKSKWLEKRVCTCGKVYTHCNKTRHEKTKYHQENVNSQQEN